MHICTYLITYINMYTYCVEHIYIFFVLYLYQNWIYNTGCCFPPLQPQSSPWCHDSPRAISCSPGRNSKMKELGHQWSLDIYSQLPSWSRNVLEKRRLKVTDVVLGHLWWQTPQVTGKSKVVWSYDEPRPALHFLGLPPSNWLTWPAKLMAISESPPPGEASLSIHGAVE